MDDKPINWEQIRIDYTTGFDGLRAIAKRYSVSYPAVVNVSVRDEWVEQRKAHRAKVATDTLAKAVDIEVDRNTRHLQIYDKGMKALEKIIDTLATSPDVKTVREAMASMKLIQDGQRLALGMDKNQGNQEAADVAKELIDALRATRPNIETD